jgi:hypothetical protein
MGMIGNTLAQGLISGANIQDGTVDTPDIKDSAVTAAKIASAVITPAKMDFSAGTANGVLYLNGSKVASSGSGLVFDGTNFGIGTSSPSTQLHVYKNAVGAANLFLENASTSAGSYGTVQFNAGTVTSQLFSDAAGGVYTAGAVLRTTSNHPLIFGTNSAERARIDASGNLLVGTTAASDWSSPGRGLLEVNGSSTALIGLKTGGTKRGYIYTQGTDIIFNADTGAMTVQSGTSQPVIFATNATERARIDSSGYALIGGTGSVGSPVGRLQVWENSNSNSYVAIDVRSVQANSTAGTRGCTTTMIQGSGGNTGSSGNVAIKFHHNDYNNLSGHLSFWTKNDSNTQLQRLTVGHDGTITFNAYGSGSLSTNASGVVSASDGRFKTKTRGIQNALGAVVQLGQLATFYRWDEDSPWHTEYEELGWFAQDVASVIPEASPEPESPLETGEDGKPYTLRYKNYQDRAILAYMAKAIEELKAEFDAYKEAHP